MIERKKRANKILLLGVDGMDPRLTRKYVDAGLLPNIKKYIERGAQRHDLVMLGGHPTVTPPMWTTLATGCNSNVHGITGFFRKGDDIDEIDYNLDSRLCKAEPLWNVLAEAGLKTLVFHWPGSSWPPTSDSENLYVVDGTAPGVVGQSTCIVEYEFLVGASEKFTDLKFMPKTPIEASAACVTDNVEEDDTEIGSFSDNAKAGANSRKNLIWKRCQTTTSATEGYTDMVQSPIKSATGWASAPEDAKEFTILFSRGLIHRPALILKNKDGIYDSVAIYKRKKDTEPIVVLTLGKLVPAVQDESVVHDKHLKVIRNMKLLRMAEDGSTLTMHVSMASHIEDDSVWHPKRIFREVADNVGYSVPPSMQGRQDSLLITECMLDNWYAVADWQAAAIQHLIEAEDLDVVFSHFHSIDLEEHMFIKHLANRPFNRQPVEVAEKWMSDLYVQADYYLGKFLHLLDEGWTIMIFSDHGQVAAKHNLPLLVDINGICTPVMEELGYTVLRRDADGNKIPEIDWTKTRAVMQRDGHIYLNIKGRNKHGDIDGIVDPADQYELEEQIITDLYGYKDPETGHRVVTVALRNKDAILLGQGGPEAGDICIWIAEGYNFDHADSLSTTYGENDTSVSPIFIAAGPGLKEGYETERVIRQVDFVPTIAVLAGVRMPEQCEGAPIYQIFAEEF